MVGGALSAHGRGVAPVREHRHIVIDVLCLFLTAEIAAANPALSSFSG
jgi:hypothetical protein